MSTVIMIIRLSTLTNAFRGFNCFVCGFLRMSIVQMSTAGVGCCLVNALCTVHYFRSVFRLISIDIVSNSSRESKFCVRLLSFSEFFTSSVDWFTSCDPHTLAKWFCLPQFLHNFTIAAQFFRYPSENIFLHRLHGLFSNRVLEFFLTLICFLLHWSPFGHLLVSFRLPNASCFLFWSMLRKMACNHSACVGFLDWLGWLFILFEFQIPFQCLFRWQYLKS